VKAGAMTREQASKSRHRNSITRAIGLATDVDPDIFDVPLEEGDTVLLCTDGLNTELTDSLIAYQMATAPTAQSAADKLVESALKHGGGDNVTVVVLRYGAFTPMEGAQIAPAEDEAPTDPDQSWKRAAPPATEEPAPAPRPLDRNGASRASQPAPVEPPPPLPPPPPVPIRPMPDAEFEDEDFDEADELEEEEAIGGGAFAVSMIVVLMLVSIALSIALMIALKNRHVEVVAAGQQGAVPPKPTDTIRTFGDPVIITKKPILAASPISVNDSTGHIYVYGLDAKTGKMLQIDLDGKVQPVTNLEYRKPGPPPDKLPLQFAIDASGHRFQINNTDRCIDEYQASTRIQRIAQGSLFAPTSVAVDNYGNVYVVDQHKLIKLEPLPTAEEFNESHKAMMPQPPEESSESGQ